MTTVLKTVRQCISHWIHTMILILAERLLAIKLYLIMTSFLILDHAHILFLSEDKNCCRKDCKSRSSSC